jgi:hypothetical protein
LGTRNNPAPASSAARPASAIPKKTSAIKKAFRGKLPLTTIYWPWFLFFLFLNYLTHSIRQVIATTSGGTVFGITVWIIFALGLPLWFYCIWRCAPNTSRPIWMYLARTSMILITYYAYGRLSFLSLIMRG